MATSAVEERLQQLDEIEKQIASVIQNAGQAVLEVSKDKLSESKLDHHTKQVLTSLQNIESELSKQIKHLTEVTCTHPHKGSYYAAHKEEQMMLKSLEHARVKLDQLNQTCNQ